MDAGHRGDAALADAGSAPEAGFVDSGRDADAAIVPVGSIEGECGVLDEEIASLEPSYFGSVFELGDGWTVADASRLSQGTRDILDDGTAGGNPGYSEAFAFEVLARCEGAELIKSETEIDYEETPGPITDILVELAGVRIGVSVTRAVTVTGRCMRADTFTDATAEALLAEKLGDIPLSTARVLAADRWVKQILFVFADTEAHAAALRRAWDGFDASLRGDTIVWVTVSEGEDGFIYFENRCPVEP
jgi:hypothetical protein